MLKLRTIFRSERGAENLRPILAGSDDHVAIPADAPVFAMESVAARFPESPLLRRAQRLRAFSKATARQIITFIVERNLAAAAFWEAGDVPRTDRSQGPRPPSSWAGDGGAEEYSPS